MVINAYEAGDGTIAEVADHFGVGTAFVKKMLRLHRAGESLAPRHGGGAAPKLDERACEQLRAAVKTRPDATLGELQAVLRRRRQLAVSEATVCRALQRLRLPRKKRVSVPANARPGSARRSAAKWQRGT
jgi:transposase